MRFDVPWTSKPAWDDLDRRITAAQEQHLQVILSLQMAKPPAEAGAVDAGNTAYTTSLKAWIDRVVEHFKGNGAVLAWMTPEEPETALQLSDSGFRKNIAERYRDINLLNRAWGTQYQGFNAISASAVVLMARQPQFALGLNRAGMDLALYKQDAFVRLMQLWARYLRAADPDRPLLAGAMARYRCLVSTPEEYDGVVARVLPGGNGPAASEAVAIARRGGRFAAIASLPTASLPDGFRGALLHGATGIAVEDWRAVSGNPRLRTLLTQLLADWRMSGSFSNQPAA
ncbi:MAG TPA: beta-galactosidase, partial [Armatimonadota bacterium]|nr:beta-galactosidase [Armatimonadota bacterium]